MKKVVVCCLLFITVSTELTRSQLSTDEMSHSLEKLFGRLRSSSDDSVSLRINDSIKFFIDSYVGSDRIFTHTFSNLKYLGQITSSDSVIKIVTWNLLLSKEPGRYFCYFIRKSPEGGANEVYYLTHTYDDKPILSDTVYSQSDWYGALYYDIMPFNTDNGKCWVLLGINYSNPMLTRKIIEVLSFTQENKLQFGRKWFDTGKSVNFRHILEYSASAIISLRFRSDSSIVFDHLVLLPPSGFDDRLYYGPDYSYDAYTYKNGFWSLSVNIDARNKQK
jgi:hypothetical protein